MSFVEGYARRLGKTENFLTYAETGNVSGASFSGTPKKFTVTLSQTQPSASYTVTITADDLRIWTVESKTTTSFVISSNADAAITGSVYWILGGNL